MLNWKKALSDAKSKIDEMAEKRRITNEENKRIREEEERQAQEYLDKVNNLLDKFEISNFDEFLKRYLNVENNVVEVHDKKNNTTYQRPMARKEYMEDIYRFLEAREITFDHLKDFALKAKIIAPSFFGMESKEVGNERDFANIINAVKADFQPENIKDEKELQSQLTIFIKAKFPELKIEREVIAKSGDKLDIVIDSNLVLELKVPKNRTHLRNLSAQLEEYAEEYPNLCAVIADTSGNILPDGKILDITKDIDEYSDKYYRKFKVPSIVLNVRMRR